MSLCVCVCVCVCVCDRENCVKNNGKASCQGVLYHVTVLVLSGCLTAAGSVCVRLAPMR